METQKLSRYIFCSGVKLPKRQRDQVVREQDLKSGDPEFKFHSDNQGPVFQGPIKLTLD